MQPDRNTVSQELAIPRLWQTIGWLGVITVIILTLMPKPPLAPSFLSWDKARHITAYAGLMWWFRQAFALRSLWVIFLIALGVILECMQGWTGYRSFEYSDMIANSLGVGCGVILAATPLGRTIVWLDRIVKPSRKLQGGV